MTTTIAPQKTKAAKVGRAKPSPQQFVTKEEFDKLTDVLGTIVGSLNELKTKTATPAEAKEEKAVKTAGQDQLTVPPAWEDAAREIIGEAVDHCEVYQPRNGGTIFTVVIRQEFSNAPKEYLERHKADRRSKDIGNEGMSGVETWCKLIRANLKRSAAK